MRCRLLVVMVVLLAWDYFGLGLWICCFCGVVCGDVFVVLFVTITLWVVALVFCWVGEICWGVMLLLLCLRC